MREKGANMVKILFLIVIIAASPAFAACPIDSNSGACVAEFQSNIQDIILPERTLSSPAKPKEFSGVKENIPKEEEINPAQNRRDFGAKGNDYGYNSSCQFGVCPDTGTPKNFSGNLNQ